MSEEYRIIIIDEENGELLTNELIDEELSEQITGIVEDGEIDNYEECETVCSEVLSMLEKIGIDTDGDHDLILKELKKMMFVKKEKMPEKKPEKKMKINKISVKKK